MTDPQPSFAGIDPRLVPTVDMFERPPGERPAHDSLDAIAEWLVGPARRIESGVRALDDALRQTAAGHLLVMACKERALSCWALLRWAGAPAALVVGLDLFPLTGHCWCEVGSRIVTDFEDRCASYMPVARYSPPAARA